MKNIEKQKAILLRESGNSIKQIAKLLNVSVSSVSLWVRHIVLTDKQKSDLLYRKIITPGQLSSSEKRKLTYNNIHNSNKKIGYERAKKDYSFRILCALYWGEGRKTGSSAGIANCDPMLIKVVTDWLIKNDYDYSFRITYHQDNWNNDKEILLYWKSKIPSLTDNKIRKSCIIKNNIASKNKKIGKCLYGTVTIMVIKSCNLLYEIFGGMEYIMDNGL